MMLAFSSASRGARRAGQRSGAGPWRSRLADSPAGEVSVGFCPRFLPRSFLRLFFSGRGRRGTVASCMCVCVSQALPPQQWLCRRSCIPWTGGQHLIPLPAPVVVARGHLHQPGVTRCARRWRGPHGPTAPAAFGVCQEDAEIQQHPSRPCYGLSAGHELPGELLHRVSAELHPKKALSAPTEGTGTDGRVRAAHLRCLHSPAGAEGLRLVLNWK